MLCCQKCDAICAILFFKIQKNQELKAKIFEIAAISMLDNLLA